MAEVAGDVEEMVYHQRIKLPYRYTAGEANQAFLIGLSEGRLLGAECAGCGDVVVPLRPFCPGCSAPLADVKELSQEGTVLSHTTRAAGTVFGIIRIDGADTSFPHRLLADTPQIGMRVRVQWAEEREAEITAIEGFVPA